VYLDATSVNVAGELTGTVCEDHEFFEELTAGTESTSAAPIST
jgi:hypothetical protein